MADIMVPTLTYNFQVTQNPLLEKTLWLEQGPPTKIRFASILFHKSDFYNL